MKTKDFVKKVTDTVSAKKEISAALVADVIRTTKDIIFEETGTDIYRTIINKI